MVEGTLIARWRRMLAHGHRRIGLPNMADKFPAGLAVDPAGYRKSAP